MKAYEVNHPTERNLMADVIVSEVEGLAYVRVFDRPIGEWEDTEVSYGIERLQQDDRGVFVEHEGSIYVLGDIYLVTERKGV